MSKTKWLLASPTTATNSMANTKLYKYLNRLVRGENLSLSDSIEFFSALTDDKAIATQVAGAITALTAKGETPEELAGMTRVIQEKAVKIDTLHKNFINTAGTDSNSGETFNASTGAAFIIAAAGLPIAKQTNSLTGDNNILGNLGISAVDTKQKVEVTLNGAGICFMYAPGFHPSLKRIGKIRRDLGIRSFMHILGALSNPAGAPRQIIGVWHPSLLDPVAKALSLLETRRAWVIHSSDGSDELTLTGETYVSEVIGKRVRKFKITPRDFGLKPGETKNLRSMDSIQNAKMITEVLSSKRRDEARSLLILNAAAALLVGGIADKPIVAARIAEQSIDSNAAQVKLERLIQTTNSNKSKSANG